MKKILVTGIVLMALAPTLQAADFRGEIRLTGSRGKISPAAGAVVWVPAVAASQKPTAVMTSRDRRFDPHVVVAQKGSTVRFPNSDRVFHNVFSTTPGQSFDLGLYKNGAEKTVKVDRAGLVRVYCNIHPEMAGYVVVLDNAASAVSDSKGRFTISGVPPGRHLVRIWHAQGGEKQMTVDVAAESGPVIVTLDASKYRPRPHKNKYGREYPSASADDSRY